MNQLNERDMDQHVTILGWLYIISNAIVLPIGLCGLLFFVGIGFATGDPTAFGILGTIGMVSMLFFAALALPGLLAGYGLLKRKKWGYFLGIIVGFLNLINFPVGNGHRHLRPVCAFPGLGQRLLCGSGSSLLP